PIVPLGLSGCSEALPKGRRLPRRARLRVLFGEAALPPFAEDPETVARQLEQRVRGLVVRLSGAPAAVPVSGLAARGQGAGLRTQCRTDQQARAAAVAQRTAAGPGNAPIRPGRDNHVGVAREAGRSIALLQRRGLVGAE